MIDFDAWSHGQITSKIWLCEKIEEYYQGPPPKIWILGGWYGMTAFLLLSRKNMKIDHIRSFDIDPSCEEIADKINNNWLQKNWIFKAITCDCNSRLAYEDEKPNIVINSSTEHFQTSTWWFNIPDGTFVVLQGNNMSNHKDHCFTDNSLKEFCDRFNMNPLYYQGEIKFEEYTRYMILGRKG